MTHKSLGSPRKIKLGIYKHYKNQKYRVFGVVRHSETLEELVYYECLYTNDSGQFWVRPYDMFLEEIEIDGKMVTRFEYVSEN